MRPHAYCRKMEGVASSQKLNYLLGDENQDDQMPREQDIAPTHDSRRPSTRADSQDSSRARANEPGRRASTGNWATLHPYRNREWPCVLPQLISNEVPRNIACGPESPVLNELDEHEKVSNSLPKAKRFGVFLKYHNDSEAQKKRPVVEEHSINTVESITNELFEKIYKDNPNHDLADYVVMDCGNISGEMTQESNVVENKPVDKKLSIKRKAKSIVQDEPAIDESAVVVKNVAPKLNTRKIPAKNYKDPIDIEKSNVLLESRNTSSPIISTKATLTRKKRKLYSPKNYENENNEITPPKTRVERRQLNVNQTPIATCYLELENARRSHRRISRISRASTPKSKKSRHGEDLSFQIRKCLSSSSIASAITMRRRRPVTPVKYIQEHYTTMQSSSEDSDSEHNIRTIKPKTASETCENVTKSIATKKGKEITTNVSKEKDSAPVRPLLGLVAETEKTRENLNSSIDLHQKFKASQISRVIPITTPEVVIERLSSDEINRWLRMPNFIDRAQKPKKYNTIRTSQLTETKIKPKLLSVKCNFDKSTVPKAQTSKNDQSFIKNSQETSKLSVMTRSIPDKALASVDRCDVNRSIASTPNSPSAAKEMLSQVIETLETIHTTGERLKAAFLKDHEEIISLKKEVQGMKEETISQFVRVEEKIHQVCESHKERACDVIRTNSENKARMKLLQEDIQRLLN